MKTAISVPDPVFRQADRFARRRKMSRSALFTQAVEEYLSRRSTDDVTERLNRVYAGQDSSLDPALQAMQTLSLSKERW